MSIDIAQTDATSNPVAGFGRLKARTNGGVTARDSAGVERDLGQPPGPIVSATVLATAIAAPAGTAAVTQLPLVIPPGKTAQITIMLNLQVTATSGLAANIGGGVQVQNPAGANGNVTGSIFTQIYNAETGAAGAGSLEGGAVVSLAANTTTNFPTARSIVMNAVTVLPIFVKATLKNNSTNTSATVLPISVEDSTGTVSYAVGSAIHGVIS